jgi:hypothetical protein
VANLRRERDRSEVLDRHRLDTHGRPDHWEPGPWDRGGASSAERSGTSTRSGASYGTLGGRFVPGSPRGAVGAGR